MNYVECKCFECGSVFQKLLSEYNRATKKGLRHFCNRSCSSKTAAKENVEKGIFVPRPENLKRGRERDEFTPFRWFLARAKTRSLDTCGRKPKENNLTLEYLKQLWESQNGICPFTGWQLELPKWTNGWTEKQKPQRASLDRIDCSKGYIQGNVRFISVIANYARNSFDDKEVIEFCKAVTEKQNGTRLLENATGKKVFQ